ncbi:MAG: hypothetical protein ACFCUE_11785 [Candidatus Bathyarchaeia archaeon]
MNNTKRSNIDNKVLDGLAWGCFFILLGIVWLTSTLYSIDKGAYVAVGVGMILIVINLTRLGVGIKVSKFSLFIGVLAFALGAAGLIGYSLDLVPTVIVLIGLFIVAEGLQRATRNHYNPNFS